MEILVDGVGSQIRVQKGQRRTLGSPLRGWRVVHAAWAANRLVLAARGNENRAARIDTYDHHRFAGISTC